MSFGTFYTHQANPRSTAILAIAKAQNLHLDIIYADTDNKENHEKLLQINPLGQVPVFVGADGYVLTECIPIALYRACSPKNLSSTPNDEQKVTSQCDTTSFLGSSRRDYYNILKWMSLANSDLLPAAGGVILPLIGRHMVVRKNTEDCLRAFYTDCKVLEEHLQKNKYLIGEQVTLADLFTVAMLRFPFMIFHKVLYPEYPRLTEWFNKVYNIPMFKDIAGDLPMLDMPFPILQKNI